MPISRHIQRATLFAAALALTLPLIAAPTAAIAASPGVIDSAGPLTSIRTSADLNCDVRYSGDTSPEFYGSIACGTFVAVDGMLYGPANLPAGGGTGTRSAYVQVSQSSPSGSGTTTDPMKVTTVVDVGSSGLRLTQVDSYATGDARYRTRITLANTGVTAKNVIVYRAGDCYVANSDLGYGEGSSGTVSCVSEGGRVARWISVSSGANYIEDSYSAVWSAVGSKTMFPNTTRGNEYIDNGAGLSWSRSVGAGSSSTIEHFTAFASDRLLSDRDRDGLPDEWETDGLDANGDGTIDVDLKAMGADPDVKDLFLETDWMFYRDSSKCILWEAICWGDKNYAPKLDAVQVVQKAFLDKGIRLHVDAGPDSIMNPVTKAKWGSLSRATKVEYQEVLGSYSGSDYNWSEFNTLKTRNFDSLRADVFHYALYVNRYGSATTDSSGIAQTSGARFVGDSFLLADGGWNNNSGFTQRQESGTLMHEFGHTLSLKHGGGDHDNYKPNYQSIMNYAWQLEGRAVDYSRQKLGDLNEEMLVESSGLPGADGNVRWYCAKAGSNWPMRNANSSGGVDWNCDGSVTSSALSANINREGDFSGSSYVVGSKRLAGYEDWSNLIFDGGAVGAFGVGDLADQDPPPELTPAIEASLEDFRDAGVLGEPGDGVLKLDSGGVLFPGVAGQILPVTISNAAPTQGPGIVVSRWV